MAKKKRKTSQSHKSMKKGIAFGNYQQSIGGRSVQNLTPSEKKFGASKYKLRKKGMR